MSEDAAGGRPGQERPRGGARRRGRRGRSRYGRYAGGDPLAPPVDLGEALDAIGQDVMAGYSPERAMREFLRQGGRDQRGLDDLARQVAERRRELLEKHGLDGTLQQVKELLDEAVLAERGQLARDVEMDDGDRAFRELRLDQVPASPAAAMQELGDYDWASPEARQKFAEAQDLLGRELLDQRFEGMKQALEGATEEDKRGVQEMLRDLNQLLEKRRLGEDTQADFDRFMEQHGQHFPEQPRDLDELMDALAQRAAAAQRMRNSMTPEQRAELDALAAQAFGGQELLDQLGQLDSHLQALRPGEDWGGSEDFEGSDGLGLGEGTGVLQDLAELDALTDQLSQSYSGARLDDVDLEALERQLGEQAGVDARTLAELERALTESGMLTRASDGQLRLSPKAMRQLGKALLKDAAERLSGRQGQRDVRRAGAAGEPSGATREWAFGDTEPWDVTRTVTNAVVRTASEGASTTSGVRLRIDDVEVQETEARTQAAVALLVDTSYSMVLADRWVPMKRTALALHQLVSSRFRGDALQLVGFGRSAQVMDIEQLTALDGSYVKGTNLHHALLLANRFFRKHPSAQPVLLVVTDGEPTAHLEPGGHLWFDYPPHPRTIAWSVRELDTARRLGAQTTIFRLGDDPGLARFLDDLAARVEGRVVAPELDDLGAAVVGSYLGGREGGPSGGGYGSAYGEQRLGWGQLSDWYGGRGFWVPGSDD